MKPKIETSGIPSRQMIESTLPSRTRREKGPFAVMECWQRIPCDPCVASCPFHAIAPMENINDLPMLDHEICTGCGLCISACPGLAIFVIDETFGGPDEASIRIPHEFAPLPEVGDTVFALGRDGTHICEARVVKVKSSKTKTTIVEIAIPKKFIADIRAIEPLPME